MAITNYVRFQRGKMSAFQALASKDKNTLYFIYEDENPSVHYLYLGENLISGGASNVEIPSLGALTDVSIDNAEPHSFLIKDSITGNWVAKTPADVAELIKEHIDISPSIDGDNLSIEILDNVIQLKNFGTEYYAYVPAKDGQDSQYVLTQGFKAGLEPKVIETDSGLALSWYEPNTEAIDKVNTKVSTLENGISEINTAIEEIESAISGINANLNAEGGLSDKVSDLEEAIGEPKTDAAAATGMFKLVEDIEAAMATKANAENVYTKTETDTAIATAVAASTHLQRKIVNSKEEIDLTAADVDLYIYMIPTGLQYEDDKYDEYVVIDGILEKVGSWEVDLKDYALKSDIVIKSVSDDFSISEEKKLTLNSLPVSKIIDLEGLLNNKVNVVEGYTLLSPEDQAKLAKLVIDEDNNLGISGSVNADNVKGLEEWLNENAGKVKGLSEHNLTDDLYEKVSQSLYITSVEPTELQVNAGKLSIVNVDSSKITGLQDSLNTKADKETVTVIQDAISEINAAISVCITRKEYEEDLAEIRDILTWKEV